MRLEIGVPISTLDLASLTQGDEGTYLCQQGGQNYLLVAAAGHSIKYGPRPIGRRIVEVNPIGSFASPEPWTVTKLSNRDISQEFERFGSSEQEQRQNR